ncbi:MAG: tetratricopeptide repeat protein [Casimicrobiaceae bacterium]
MAHEPTLGVWRRTCLILAISTGVAGAFTAAPAAAQTEKAPQSNQDTAIVSELSPEVVYRLLVADVALQRGQAAIAARAYYEVARSTRNVVFARRATDIAVATRQVGIARGAAKLWSELDPAAERPRDIVATLEKEGGTDAVLESLDETPNLKSHLERLLARAARQGPAAISEAFLQLNRLLLQERDREAALKLAQELAAPYDSVSEAHLVVAFAAYSTGLAEMTTATLAMKEVDRALALDPTSERGALLRAEILGKRSPDTAIAWLESVYKAQPASRPVASALAQRYLQQKRYADARGVFEALLAKDPGSREIRLALAALSMQAKDWPAAENGFEALQRDGKDDDGTLAYYLAEIAEETGRLPLAVERYRAVPQGERGWLAQLRIATVLGKMKRLDEARRHLADLPAVTIEQRVQVRQAEAQLARDSGDYKAAFGVLEGALVEHPDNPDLLYDAAMVAEKIDRIDLAEQKLQRVVALRPDNAQAWNALGYTLVDRTDRFAEGLEYIERAHKLSPDDAFILDSMGWAHYRLGRLDEAERYLRQAIAGRPDAEIAAHLGEVLWARGERARAQEIWQTQLKNAPDNPVLLETVRRLAR